MAILVVPCVILCILAMYGITCCISKLFISSKLIHKPDMSDLDAIHSYNEDLKAKRSVIVAVAIGSFVTCFVTGIMEVYSLFLVTLVCGFLFCCAGAALDMEKIPESEYKNLSSQYFHFTEDSGIGHGVYGTLTVYKKHPSLKQRLHYSEAHEVNLHYDPEKIHIGGASVGGVFTGGVYKTGGNYELLDGKALGVYYLFYCENPSEIPQNRKSFIVHDIVFAGELREDAKKRFGSDRIPLDGENRPSKADMISLISYIT